MRIGTRASALALAQARLVADGLAIGQQGECELVPIVTSGDRQRRPGAGEDDKSRWVGELERALERGEIDLAVHSAKDVPGELAEGLVLSGSPKRAGAEDVLCGAGDLQALGSGARVGTSSLRRAAQLRAAREDLEVVAIGGNVDTRLDKLQRGELDALVIARAGLQRLAREDAIGAVLDPARFVPAPGQGALALQTRADDGDVQEALAAIIDADTFTCLLAERALARALGADCHTPLGAHATARGAVLTLRAWVGAVDGSAWICDELEGDAAHPEQLAAAVGERLYLAGAGAILERARELDGAQAARRATG